MKKYVFILKFTLLFVIIICISLCTLKKYSDSEYIVKGTLYVLGKRVTDKDVIIHCIKNSSYANIPLLETMKSLGFTINCNGDDIVVISNKNKKYFLNKKEGSLIEEGGDINLFVSVFGGNQTIYTKKDDLIVDTVTLIGVLREMGIYVYDKFDYDKSIVYITDKNN